VTIAKMYHVNCDGFTSADQVDCPGWAFESDTRAEVASALRHSEWRTVGRRHYCPVHAPALGTTGGQSDG
jgi:hypothetical protein